MFLFAGSVVAVVWFSLVCGLSALFLAAVCVVVVYSRLCVRLKVIGCSSLRGGGGELGTLKT